MIKEGKTDKVKYNNQAWEVQGLLGKRYWTTGTHYRWFSVYRRLFGIPLPLKVADIYAVDDEGYGDMKIYKKDVYEKLKNYAKEKNFSKITVNW